MNRYIIRGVAICFCLLASCGTADSGVLVVYYLTPEIQTYTPVTEASIICEAEEKWTLLNEKKVTELRSILRSGSSAEFNLKSVRMLVVDGPKRYYMDQNGVVSEGLSEYRVDLDKVIRFRSGVNADDVTHVFSRDQCPPKNVLDFK